MKDVKKTSSIAWKITSSWLGRLFFSFLLLDICLILLTVAGWCYTQETAALGTWEPFLHRSFSLDHTLPIWRRMDTAVYSFQLADGPVYTAAAGDFFQTARYLFTVLLVLELIMILGSITPGLRKARHALRPLNEMAATAQQLSHLQDEDRFRDLEAAISQISPNRPDARLATGDRDLQGLEQAVNSLLQRMHESYRQQARFVSDASHELRTPIAVIQGYANLLDRWGKDDEQILLESIAAIKSESDHMKKLVEQLLFLARGDSGRTTLNPQHFSLSNMMTEVWEESCMIDTEHEWVLEAAEPIEAYGDVSMLKQAIRILADNAAKYTLAGDTIYLRALQKDGQPCFEVQDSGIGIASEDIPHVFERFFRSDPARSRQSGGSGLGLSIAKWIVDKHDGFFEVLSREEIGTRITVHLPKPPQNQQKSD